MKRWHCGLIVFVGFVICGYCLQYTLNRAGATIELTPTLVLKDYSEPMQTMHILDDGREVRTEDLRWRRVIFLDANDIIIGDFTRLNNNHR